VRDERLRADFVVDKLTQDYSRFFTLEAYRWEHEPMLASGHFQDALEPPSAFDILILIVWSRLGTPLPEHTTVREYRGIDGRTPVTGTEWEFEEALKSARERGVPDILAFRNISDAPIETRDSRARAIRNEQLDELDRFWKRHFADRGVILAAYHEYRSTEEFARRIEESLRKLIDRRINTVAAGVDAQAPIWFDAPFRGLQTYKFEHAPIFFGRDALVGKAAEQLAIQAHSGSAFLLVSGPSGSGKSSLVQAGLVPRLMKPQRISRTAFIRRAVFRPSEGGHNLVLGLVETLTRGASEPDIGLPELLAPGQDAGSLAAHLRSAADDPSFAFANALGHLTQAGRKAGRLLAFEDAKLILVIDQLEELFTKEGIGPDDRRLFARLLAGLARSRVVWVVATLRSDFWHLAAQVPELMGVTQGRGRLDVPPPSAAELAEMIRKPAQAASVSFEVHDETGLGLDAVLAEHAASEAGVLPLLSFTLDALYTGDVIRRNGRVLTYATYKALGGLEGAIATRAEEVFARLPEKAQATLPRVLRSLATVATATHQVAVVRPAPLTSFVPGSDVRAVVDALTAERLLVASHEGTTATVRLAHEALISHWKRAHDQLAHDRRDLETRMLVERQQMRWQEAAGRVHSRLLSQLLLRDPDLANAIDLDGRWGDELDARTRRFIQESKRHARRQHRRTQVVAAGFALLAVAASTLGVLAYRSQEQASHERDQALLRQSRLLVAQSRQLAEQENYGSAIAVAIEGYYTGLKQPDLGFVVEAEAALFDAANMIRERAVLSGHDREIRGAATSPDGHFAATASSDKTAHLWDAQTGGELGVFSGHQADVWSAAFSPDGRKIVTGSRDQTARVWEIATLRQLAVLTGHRADVWSAAFSPDGQRVVTASADGTACVWNAETGQQLRVLPGHKEQVLQATFSLDGRRVLTASWDRTARIWDAETGQELAVFKGHDRELHGAAFSPDGKRIVTASADATARVWNVETRQDLITFKGHNGTVSRAAFSPDGRNIVTASFDNTARLWNAETGQQLGILAGHEGPVASAEFTPDGRRVLTASSDKTARLWDTETADRSMVLRGHEDDVWTAVFSPDGRKIVTASGRAGGPREIRDNTARIWDAESGKPLNVLRGHTDTVQMALFSPDGERVLTASWDGTARIWDAQTARELMMLVKQDKGLESAAFSPDARKVVTSSVDGVVRVWDVQTPRELTELKGHQNTVWTAYFSPDGRTIVTASWDGTARLWDAETGQQLKVLSVPGTMSSAAFSPDGRWVATGSKDELARIWDVQTGKMIRELVGHADSVSNIAFSPDGLRLVTASRDRTARIWDTGSGQLLAVLKGHQGHVWGAAFSPDGRRVATASADKTVRVWRLFPSAPALVEYSMDAVPRCLTRSQREGFSLDPDPPAWCIEKGKWPYDIQASKGSVNQR
jgi:WD40 repeat protein